MFVADTNHHTIKLLDVKSKKTRDLNIVIPTETTKEVKRLLNPEKTKIVKKDIVISKATEISLNICLELPADTHVSKEAPSKWNLVQLCKEDLIESKETSSAITSNEYSLKFQCTGTSGTIQVECMIYFCKDTEEVCLADSVIFEIELKPSKKAEAFIDCNLKTTLSGTE